MKFFCIICNKDIEAWFETLDVQLLVARHSTQDPKHIGNLVDILRKTPE